MKVQIQEAINNLIHQFVVSKTVILLRKLLRVTLLNIVKLKILAKFIILVLMKIATQYPWGRIEAKANRSFSYLHAMVLLL